MKTFRPLVALASLLGVVVTGFAVIPSVHAASQILPNATVEADEQTVAEVIGTFDQAQEAIRARNLDGLMALYAQGYQYYGLRKDDIRQLWADLFAHYEHIANMHVFSTVKLVGSGNEARVEITCTGALWAVSKDTKARIPIDSWHGEVHHLVKEKGAWRILGNVGGESPRPRQFGTAPHPLF
jgi:hypothetical protein